METGISEPEPRSGPGTFLSSRLFRLGLGLLAGTANSLVFGVLYHQDGFLTPWISTLLMMFIANLFDPMQAAGAAAILGLPVGLAFVLQANPGLIGDQAFIEIPLRIILAQIAVPLGILFYAWTGLVFGTISKLYKRGAIF